MNDYTNDQIITLLDNYFRDAVRPMPYPDIAERMCAEGVADAGNAINRLLWGIITGYAGTVSPRRAAPVWPEGCEHYRAGWTWHDREDRALRHALAGAGQERNPPVDIPYIAAVLARPEAEVVARWAHLTSDSLGRPGFFETRFKQAR